MKMSAGTLLYQKTNEGLKVLIVHPSGDYNKNAPWSIPKGEVENGDSEVGTAVRETLEEVGIGISETQLTYLGEEVYDSRKKKVMCYVGQVPTGTLASSPSWEIDEAKWVTPDEAIKMLHKNQRGFAARIKEMFENVDCRPT